MTRKNPYEKGTQELDIPDFVEDKTNTSTDSTSIDMSIFKMSDDELYDDVEAEDYAEDYDEKPKKKRKANSSMVLALIIIFLLLGACVGAIIYAYKQHQEYVKVNTAYMQVQANEENYKQQIAEKDATIQNLTQQIEALQNQGAQGEGNMIYVIVDGGMRFRKAPTSDAELTEYNGASQVENGEKYRVIEVVNDKDLGDQYTWAKVADEVYFCLGTKDEVWAKKVD